MYNASANFNTTANQSGRETSLKIYYPDQDIEITDENIILAFSFSDTLVEDEGQSHIGSFVAKTIRYQIDMLNPNFIALISKNATIEVSMGLKVEGVYEYVPMGTYTVVDFSHDKKTGNAEIEAYDYSLAFDHTYNYTIESPMTIAQYASALCFMVEVELGSVSWFNSDLIVDTNTFVGGTYRNAIQMIAQATLTFAKIGRDNKLYFKNFTASGLILDNVFENEVKDTYGPVNQVVFRKGDTGDDILDKNQISIDANGLTEIVLDDNEIINWQNREAIVGGYLTEIDGFTYDVAVIEFPGNPAIDSGDILSYIDGDDVTHTLYVFNHNFEHTGGWYATIEAVALSKTLTSANYVGDYDKRIKNAEILVNKVDGEITAVVESQDELETKVGELEFNYDEFILSFTRTVHERKNKLLYLNDVHMYGAEYGFNDGFSDIIYSVPEMYIASYNEGINEYFFMPPNEIRMYGMKKETNYTFSADLMFETVPSTAYDVMGLTFSVWVYTDTTSPATQLVSKWFDAFPDEYASDFLTFSLPANAIGWYLKLSTNFSLPVGQNYQFMHITLNNLQLEEGSSVSAFSNEMSTISGARYIFDGENASFYNGGLRIYKSDTTGETQVMGADINGDLWMNSLKVNNDLTVEGVSRLKSALRILGNGTGVANSSWVGFYNEDGSEREGYVGVGSTNSRHVILTSETGNVRILSSFAGGIISLENDTIVDGTMRVNSGIYPQPSSDSNFNIIGTAETIVFRDGTNPSTIRAYPDIGHFRVSGKVVVGSLVDAPKQFNVYGDSNFAGQIIVDQGGNVGGNALILNHASASTNPSIESGSSGDMLINYARGRRFRLFGGGTSDVFAINESGVITLGTVPWARLSEVPSSFPPSSHGHTLNTGIGLSNDGGNLAARMIAITSGSGTGGALWYNGTSNTTGRLNGGSTNPTATTRLNYAGIFYASGLRYGSQGNISVSDKHTKKDIGSLNYGVDLILNLKPKQFRFKPEFEPDEEVIASKRNAEIPTSRTAGRERLHYGFIAQEVEELTKQLKINRPSYIREPSQDDKYYGLAYEEFIAPMVQTIQYLNSRIDELENLLKGETNGTTRTANESATT